MLNGAVGVLFVNSYAFANMNYRRIVLLHSFVILDLNFSIIATFKNQTLVKINLRKQSKKLIVSSCQLK